MATLTQLRVMDSDIVGRDFNVQTLQAPAKLEDSVCGREDGNSSYSSLAQGLTMFVELFNEA
jgi:hypothetical protein